MRLEKDAVLRSLTVDVQLRFCTLTRGQGLKVDALGIFNESPALVIWLQDANGGILYRLRHRIVRRHPKRKCQAI